MISRHFSKKTLLAVFLCGALLLPLSGCAEKEKSTVPYLISSVTVKNNTKKTVKLYYDDAFRVIKRNIYNKDSLYTTETMTYDEGGFQNSLTESTAVLGYEKKDIWENNSDGNKLTGTVTTEQFGEKTVTEYTYTYNEKGQVTHYAETDEDGSLVEEKTWVYTDEFGSSVCTSGYSVVEEVLNEAGNRLSYVVKSSDGTETSRYEYTYDETGNVTKDISNGVTTLYENTYENNRLVKSVSLSDDTVTASTEYLYDEYGNLIRYTVTDATGVTTEESEMTYSFLPVD